MFSKAGPSPHLPHGREAARSVISADVRIEGSLATDGVLEFDGSIVGDLQAHALGIGRSAQVRGNVSGAFVTVDGTVEGDVVAATLTLKPTAVVSGALSYGAVTVESGAVVNGRFSRLPEPATIEAPDPVPQVAETDADASDDGATAGPQTATAPGR